MKMFINGASVDASNGEVIEVINPATGAVVDTVPAATKEDVDLAVEKAAAAKLSFRQVISPRRLRAKYTPRTNLQVCT